jgi:hypothetical protein
MNLQATKALDLFYQAYERRYRHESKLYGSPSDAYVMWATVRYRLENPYLQIVNVSTTPKGLRGRADQLARETKAQYRIWAPTEAGANLRQRWNHPQKPHIREFNLLIDKLSTDELRQLDDAFLNYVLTAEKTLESRKIKLRPDRLKNLIIDLLGQQTYGRFQQGVVYAVVKVTFDKQGWTTTTKKVFTADRFAVTTADIEVRDEENELAIVYEVTGMALDRNKVENTLQKATEENVRVIFLAPVTPPEFETYNEYENISVLKDEAYVKSLLAHLNADDKEAVISHFQTFLSDIQEWSEGLTLFETVAAEYTADI